MQYRQVIPYLHWMANVPKRKQVDSESTESIVAKTMNGVYHGLLGLYEGIPIGLMIYQMVGQHKIKLKFLYAKSHIAQFYMDLMKYLNKYSIDEFEFDSFHEPKLYDRMFPGRTKKLRSTYSFDVAGLFKETILSLSQKKRLKIQRGE